MGHASSWTEEGQASNGISIILHLEKSMLFWVDFVVQKNYKLGK